MTENSWALGVALIGVTIVLGAYRGVRTSRGRMTLFSLFVLCALGVTMMWPTSLLLGFVVAGGGLGLSVWWGGVVRRLQPTAAGVRRRARLLFFGTALPLYAMAAIIGLAAAGPGRYYDGRLDRALVSAAALSTAGLLGGWAGSALFESTRATVVAAITGAVWAWLCLTAGIDALSAVLLATGVGLAVLGLRIRFPVSEDSSPDLGPHHVRYLALLASLFAGIATLATLLLFAWLLLLRPQ